MDNTTKHLDINIIKSILQRKRMTMQDLANKMGKERSVVYKTISNGNPTLSFLLSLCNILESPLEKLVSQNDVIHKEQEKEFVDGFIEINGKTYRVHSKRDILKLFDK